MDRNAPGPSEDVPNRGLAIDLTKDNPNQTRPKKQRTLFQSGMLRVEKVQKKKLWKHIPDTILDGWIMTQAKGVGAEGVGALVEGGGYTAVVCGECLGSRRAT